jgi:transposase
LQVQNTEQTLMEANIAKNRVIRFKTYDQSQVLHVPVEIDKLIPSCHLVRIVNECIDKLDMSLLEVYYNQYGCPSFHPKMMIKLWIYGYCERIYTSLRDLS